ncbi:hypothetical protein JCM11491_007044 [Sporobolomyces phaffii]
MSGKRHDTLAQHIWQLADSITDKVASRAWSDAFLDLIAPGSGKYAYLLQRETTYRALSKAITNLGPSLTTVPKPEEFLEAFVRANPAPVHASSSHSLAHGQYRIGLRQAVISRVETVGRPSRHGGIAFVPGSRA